jgi:hypothetical protein
LLAFFRLLSLCHLRVALGGPAFPGFGAFLPPCRRAGRLRLLPRHSLVRTSGFRRTFPSLASLRRCRPAAFPGAAVRPALRLCGQLGQVQPFCFRVPFSRTRSLGTSAFRLLALVSGHSASGRPFPRSTLAVIRLRHLVLACCRFRLRGSGHLFPSPGRFVPVVVPHRSLARRQSRLFFHPSAFAPAVARPLGCLARRVRFHAPAKLPIDFLCVFVYITENGSHHQVEYDSSQFLSSPALY